ncbi:hypothetical protein DSO57_1007803 [Entomophthora muscae]|uniref:Uncharacterized protein n=1 Tax=Entomophthora muscae TaxID=34485 RepID=A0ACC2S961_9FUNG|nr:hypothetical protein DSO57_1007803 [Entomophthora muscae]
MDSMIRSLSFTVYYLSIACGMLVVLMIVVGGVVNRALVDRVSLRLTLAISVVDVAKAIVLVLYMYMDQDTFTCSLVSFFIQWFTLVYLLLNSAILFNMQLIYFQGVSFKRSLEAGYWLFCFLFPTLLLVPPLAAGRLGYDKGTEGCEYKDPTSKATNVWLWCCFTFWVMVACVYSATTALYIVVTLPRSSSLVSRMTNRNSYTQDSGYHRNVSRLIKRLCMICLIPVFTQTYMIISAVKFYCGIELSSFDKILATISIGNPSKPH